ncbi:MAG TPA: TonB-dependent receptor [Thermoanaerobaculia bacterium]|nr:TonB-dependent receptor [Thermoanaerobaculia bacterium]
MTTRVHPTDRSRTGASAAARLVLQLFVLALVAGSASAQTTSTLEGRITDPEGDALPGASVVAEGAAVRRTTTSDASGDYRIPALPPGTYTVTISAEGFSTMSRTDLEIALNRTVTLDAELAIGSIEETVTVTAEPALIETRSSSTGTVVTPAEIENLPVNGRNYLDLLQLVPGVTVNRAADEGSDSATPILGERAGNSIYLVDGMPNRDEFGGGAAVQFNQDTIFEFEVITDGYKAEFGHGSGGVINVVTKSGTNEWRGLGFVYARDDSLDSSNSLDEDQDAPELERQNFGLNVGGPLADDVFFFASGERIDEDRQLNFSFPPATPALIRDFERSFDDPTRDEQTRLFVKLDEQIGDAHRLTQQVSYTDGELGDFLPLSSAASLPSTRRNFEDERTMIGLRDVSLLGAGDPWVLEAFAQYRDETSLNGPAHPEAGPSTAFNIFSSPNTFQVFGDLGTVSFGSSIGAGEIDQEYTAAGVSGSKTLGEDHLFEAGIDFLRTQVDGLEARLLSNQLFATEENFVRFGPVNSGFFTLTTVGGLAPEDDLIRLRNDYTGAYVQDDWQIGENLVLNLGVRWDYDAEFDDSDNFGPRLGFAWSIDEKTVLRGSYGVFYDRFRLGLVRNVPPFGGSSRFVIQPFSYPQLFNNVTTIAPVLFGLCINPTLSDAQISAGGVPCPLGPFPHIGNDRLNNLVAPGRSPVPGETVVTVDNVQELTGLTPDEYLAQVTAAVPLPPGFEWFWGSFGVLSHTGVPPGQAPVTLDPSFETPSTDAWHLGLQRQLGRHMVVGLDYHHREMNDILGVRQTNLAFISRIPGNQRTFEEPSRSVEINGFGPWFEGELDAVTLTFDKRFADRWALSAYYTYTDAVDNLRVSQLGSGSLVDGTGPGYPSDSFIGIVPEVFDPTTGQSNADGPFTAGNGNPVPQAGTFYNGPDLDRGTSGLALEHTALLYGMLHLPLDFELAAILRYQSGFPFSRGTDEPLDVDGNLNFNGNDKSIERNRFESPDYTSLDLRAGWRFPLGERFRGLLLIEFFNVTNEQNPAAVENIPGRLVGFGEPLQVLPGREGQIGVRLEF